MPAVTLAELKQQEKDARKNLILEAARELFAVKDFRQVTVREIAKQAGVSVGTIYNNYESLDELFLDIILQCSQEIAVKIDQRAQDADTRVDFPIGTKNLPGPIGSECEVGIEISKEKRAHTRERQRVDELALLVAG